MGRRIERIPVWVWLAAIVVGSAVFRAIVGRGIVAPFIMVDEVIWAEIARGFADAGEPLLRDEPNPGYSVVYPLVISPAYALAGSLPDAYEVVKSANAALMSLAALPAYFVARRVVAPGLSLLAALLAVALPSLAYTGTVMTENVFYPLFLVVVLALLLVLEQPTWLRVALLLALLGAAFATRVQTLALVPAVLTAPLLLAVFERRGFRETLGRYRILYLAFAALGALAVTIQLAGGRSLDDLLGAYEPVGEASYGLGEVLEFVVWHAAEMTLYVLVLPLAATIVLAARARSLDRPLQAFLAATIAVTAFLVPVVAAFASRFSDRIEERNLFYVAPLLLIALLAWIERGAPRPRILAPVAALASALLVLLVPFDRFLATSAITDTLMLLPFWSLQDRVGSGWVTPIAFALALALAAAFLFVPARYAIALPLVVLGLWAIAFKPIWWGTHGFERFSRGSLFQGIRTAEKDWIDRAPARLSVAPAAFLWTGRTDRLTVNQNEFFNRGVGPIYYVDKPTPGGLPETRVTIDPDSGLVTLPDGTPVEDPFVISDSSFEPDGVALARDRGWGITLWRTNPPLVSAVRIDGLYPNDTWSGETVTYLRRRCQPGRLVVDISSDGSLFLEPQGIFARSSSGELATLALSPGAHRKMLMQLRPDEKGECRVDFTVTPTAVPSEVMPGSGDHRELGVHFNRFVYTPLR